MAEFPDLGKHCSLSSCNRLDFTPFKCDFCLLHFCVDHRFPTYHGCKAESTISRQQLENCQRSQPSSAEDKKFLCSFSGCFVYELSRFECSLCQRGYCISHRRCEDHMCEKLKPSISSSDNSNERKIQPMFETKALDPAQQARADKIALMKAKMSSKLKLPPDEQLFIFVRTANNERFPILVGKRWTIDSTSTFIKTHLKLTDPASLFSPSDLDTPLPGSDGLTKHFTDKSEVFIKALNSDNK